MGSRPSSGCVAGKAGADAGRWPGYTGSVTCLSRCWAQAVVGDAVDGATLAFGIRVINQSKIRLVLMRQVCDEGSNALHDVQMLLAAVQSDFASGDAKFSVNERDGGR